MSKYIVMTKFINTFFIEVPGPIILVSLDMESESET